MYFDVGNLASVVDETVDGDEHKNLKIVEEDMKGADIVPPPLFISKDVFN